MCVNSVFNFNFRYYLLFFFSFKNISEGEAICQSTILPQVQFSLNLPLNYRDDTFLIKVIKVELNIEIQVISECVYLLFSPNYEEKKRFFYSISIQHALFNIVLEIVF